MKKRGRRTYGQGFNPPAICPRCGAVNSTITAFCDFWYWCKKGCTSYIIPNENCVDCENKLKCLGAPSGVLYIGELTEDMYNKDESWRRCIE